MTERDPHVQVPEPPRASESPSGLRLRIWLACLAGALVMALGLWWVAGSMVGLHTDPAQVIGWLAGIGGVGIVVGAGLALWLDHSIVGHLRGLTRGLASGRVQELRGLPAASGWGELSELTDWAQVLITRQRLSSRATTDLEQLEAQLGRAAERLARWRLSEHWESLPAPAGQAESIVLELNAALERASEIGRQNLEASRRAHADLTGATDEARASAEFAERGFVEATALLTTVRELQRLGTELRAALVEAPVAGADGISEAARAELDAYRGTVAAAIAELIEASNASIEHLGAALMRVQEIAGEVQLVSNRATLVALHAVTLEARLPSDQRGGEELSSQLRQLTADVRGASQRADELAAEVEHQTRVAGERMQALRESVALRIETHAEPILSPPVPMAAPERVPAAVEPAARLLERVREMIQDATQKGERLSAAGERASRAADRLLHRLEDQCRDLEGLVMRLAPGGELPEEPLFDRTDDAESLHAARLRLLEADAAEGADAAAGEGEAAPDAEPRAREERP